MKAKKPAEPMRLQIPVDKGLAEYIAHSAEVLKLTQAGLVDILLSQAIDNRKRYIEWIAYRIGVSLGKTFAGVTWEAKGEQTYVQAFITSEMEDELKRLALPTNNTVPRAAALLLESAVWESDWIVSLFETSLGQTIIKAQRRKQELASKSKAA